MQEQLHTMKKYLILCFFLPLGITAQQKSKPVGNSKTAVKENLQPAEGYTIEGKVIGYPDGTVVDMLNGNGAPEMSTSIANGSFRFNGKMEFPDFKLIAFNKSQPYITMLLDNSNVTINATKDALDQAVVKGSKSNDDFIAYNKVTKPFEKLFAPDAGGADSAEIKKAASVLDAFSRKYSQSYIAPLAIYRTHQLSGNGAQLEDLFNRMSDPVKTSPMGNYIAQQVAEVKKNPMGKPLPDFSQEDINGVPVSLSSFKGKYVLIDFWASWCGPCRQENPNVVNAYQKYKDKNFTVLGISLDKTKQPWLDAIKNDGLTWTQLSDLKGWANAVAQKFQINSIPQNFLVDPSGVVIGKNLRGAALDAKLASILK